jgi:hypothetical protein
MPELFPEELRRIRFRQRLMEAPGGVDYLCHVSRLYKHTERLIAPDRIGLTDALRAELHRAD